MHVSGSLCYTQYDRLCLFPRVADTQITDEGARALGEALRVNQSLKTLE